MIVGTLPHAMIFIIHSLSKQRFASAHLATQFHLETRFAQSTFSTIER